MVLGECGILRMHAQLIFDHVAICLHSFYSPVVWDCVCRDKLPFKPKSTLPNANPHEISPPFDGEEFKPDFTDEEAQRQLELEACSVFATYRLLRSWVRCLNNEPDCAQAK